eukprot:CAMPEP_0206256996 /NCGR_PEP_ID=MMETSP0047_2-20121206/25085_1 /ASSEMBLY_ACC=CAM_ASM_000192 /TAXON_ID=195065 /ORGANISM="Chroomonas mesostigmatica_cf, Strain CCMP1168" /LENGTH=136 /DNA_ID=CAMNT_0053683513 /DNA_START=380 /DNA_END=790 /DNA_ORIENTATION=-
MSGGWEREQGDALLAAPPMDFGRGIAQVDESRVGSAPPCPRAMRRATASPSTARLNLQGLGMSYPAGLGGGGRQQEQQGPPPPPPRQQQPQKQQQQQQQQPPQVEQPQQQLPSGQQQGSGGFLAPHNVELHAGNYR